MKGKTGALVCLRDLFFVEHFWKNLRCRHACARVTETERDGKKKQKDIVTLTYTDRTRQIDNKRKRHSKAFQQKRCYFCPENTRLETLLLWGSNADIFLLVSLTLKILVCLTSQLSLDGCAYLHARPVTSVKTDYGVLLKAKFHFFVGGKYFGHLRTEIPAVLLKHPGVYQDQS